MKNLILGFLVFITIFSKGQSVDPETFPTVVGSIGNKNVYTNTGGEGKISVQSILDSAKLISGDFIPLSGTEIGKPVTGDIEISEMFSIKNGIRTIKFTDENSIGLATEDTSTTVKGSINIGVASISSLVNDGLNQADLEFITEYLKYSSDNPASRGFSGGGDYTANITDLDYTQKKYVDKKVAKIGTDDIEITDFNKGIILTAPNSSRYRITVDNSGNLITTLIP